ncbi:MAG: polyisoprenyl-phosphate glycosyltransferase [Gaiellaceae bacterium]|nr:polyisoprenyl-phosphate glycosyltransferase [Gaiellaceae bacterium]
MEARPDLSVVVPIFNEEATIPELHRRLVEAVAPLGACELIYVDDGSSDRSWQQLLVLGERSPGRVRLLRLSRNFGHQIAITAGLEVATGQAVVTIDGDLQDPPELIPELVARWREGYDVVSAVRIHRDGESRFKLATAALFYKLIRRMSQVEIVDQAGDYRLLSRRAADALATLPERARFLRGMTSWIGFPHAEVPYRRDVRHAGTTKYPLRKMLRFAVDGVTSFSTVPIRLVSLLGLGLVFLSGLYLVWVLYLRLFTDRTVQGWSTVVVLVLVFGGVQLLSLGVVGQYVGRIFEEVKRRPLYVVEERVDTDAGRETVAEPADGQSL